MPEPHLRVILRGGKTDTDNQGFIRYVSPNSVEPLYCPVRLTELYLRRIGPAHSGFLVARTQTAAGRRLCLDGRYRLPYSRARSDLQDLLTAVGLPLDECSEHSARRGAVTKAADSGLTYDSIQSLVGWKSAQMPKLYTDRSIRHYLSCSSKLQL